MPYWREYGFLGAAVSVSAAFAAEIQEERDDEDEDEAENAGYDDTDELAA